MKLVAALALCLAFASGGCSMVLDDNSAVFSAAPGKYDYLDCKGIAERTETNSKRTAELDGLMQKASQSSGGQVIGTMVYKDEYNTVQGDQLALRKAADEKRCSPDLRSTAQAGGGGLSPMH